MQRLSDLKRRYGLSNHFSTFIAPAFALLIFSVLGVYFLGGSKAATVISGGPAELLVTPATTSVAQGQPVQLTIELNANGEVTNAVQANLSYSTDDLEYVSVSQACLEPFGITAEATANKGHIKIACGSINGISGQAKVATVTFKARKASGNTTMQFDTGSTVLRKDDNKSMLNNTTGSTINFVK